MGFVMKIAVFTPKTYRAAFEEAIRGLNRRDCFFCLEYSDFYEIASLYRKYEKQIDGILFSGALPENYFHSRFPSARLPVCSMRHSRLLTALALLRFSRECPQFPLTKVFGDGIANVIDRKLYEDYLGTAHMPRCLTTWHYTDHMLEQLSEEILRLYETGEISHGFFPISSLYEQAASRGFPCTHIALLPENIREGLNRILALTENRKKTENIALTMILDYAGKGGPDYNEREYREATLKKLLVDYKREKQLSGLSIESSNGRLELNLSAPCDPAEPWQPLLDCLGRIREAYPAALNAGIGIGQQPFSARGDALSALSFAEDFSDSCCFCLQDGTLTGPLLSDCCLTIHTNLLGLSANLASELSVSPMNYVRTITLLEGMQAQEAASASVTSELLARYLHVTVRSANRILSALAKRKIIRERSLSSPAPGKGRPVRFYELSDSSHI